LEKEKNPMHGQKEKQTKRQSMAQETPHGRQRLRNTNPTKNRK
jgi:hypothetical protein